MTKIYLSLFTNFRFSGKVSGPTKTSKKDQSFYNTVLLKNPHSFYEPQLTQNHQSYTPATQSKHVSGLSQKKHLRCTISQRPTTAFSEHLECLYDPVNLRSKNFCYGEVGSFLLGAFC